VTKDVTKDVMKDVTKDVTKSVAALAMRPPHSAAESWSA